MTLELDDVAFYRNAQPFQRRISFKGRGKHHGVIIVDLKMHL
jgi:hypothetical protein